jgi:hypothetical protein
MAAVLFLLSREEADIRVADDKEKPTYEIPEYRDRVKNAVPGSNSKLMHLAINSKVSEAVIDDPKKEIKEKVRLIASRIREFVVI